MVRLKPATATAPAFSDTPPPTALDRLGDEVASLAARVHAVTYLLLEKLAVFDREFASARGGLGFQSSAHWLSWRTGVSPGAAREKVRVARRMEKLPLLSAAMAEGCLSYSLMRALTRIATPDNEAELLELTRHTPAAQVERLTRLWRRVDRLEKIDAAQLEADRHERRRLTLYPDDDGSWVIRGRLDPEVGALLERALDAAMNELFERAAEAQPDGDVSAETSGQRRADALALVVEQGGSGGGRLQVILHREVDGTAHLDHRVGVSAETSERLACDASRTVMTHTERQTLDVGRRHRTPPWRMRRALEHRDRGICVFPGCTSRHCDAHHGRPWSEGGETRLDNLFLLCRRHHRMVHEGGWRVDRGPDQRVRFTRPNGRVLPAVPRRVAAHQEPTPGLGTPTPQWAGASLDVPLVLDALRSPISPPAGPGSG